MSTSDARKKSLFSEDVGYSTWERIENFGHFHSKNRKKFKSCYLLVFGLKSPPLKCFIN